MAIAGIGHDSDRYRSCGQVPSQQWRNLCVCEREVCAVRNAGQVLEVPLIWKSQGSG